LVQVTDDVRDVVRIIDGSHRDDRDEVEADAARRLARDVGEGRVTDLPLEA
jgi:hypothetical protein